MEDKNSFNKYLEDLTRKVEELSNRIERIEAELGVVSSMNRVNIDELWKEVHHLARILIRISERRLT